MPPEPILDAETIITTAMRDAIAPVVGTHNGRPKVYWKLAEPRTPLPYIVFQPQTDITRVDRIGSVDATALITLRALAADDDQARSLLALAAPTLATLAYPGYSITARYVRSPNIPALGGAATSAHIFRISIERI